MPCGNTVLSFLQTLVSFSHHYFWKLNRTTSISQVRRVALKQLSKSPTGCKELAFGIGHILWQLPNSVTSMRKICWINQGITRRRWYKKQTGRKLREMERCTGSESCQRPSSTHTCSQLGCYLVVFVSATSEVQDWKAAQANSSFRSNLIKCEPQFAWPAYTPIQFASKPSNVSRPRCLTGSAPHRAGLEETGKGSDHLNTVRKRLCTWKDVN